MRETGIGYPDVTLFPLIAELFGVDIGILFGQSKEKNENTNHNNEKKFVLEPFSRVEFLVGNECDIRVIEKENEKEPADKILDRGKGRDYVHKGAKGKGTCNV